MTTDSTTTQKLPRGRRLLPAVASLPLAAALALAAALLIAPTALPAAASQDLEARIAAEVERLQKVVDSKPLPDPDWKTVRPEVASGLHQVGQTLKERRVYLALERLQVARAKLRSIELAKAAAAIAANSGGGMAGFDAAWHRIGADIEAADKRSRERRWGDAPLALRAMAEAAQGTTMELLAASRAYAGATQPAEAYIYLGQAGAAAEFSELCYSFRDAAPPAPPADHGAAAIDAPLALHSVRPELRRLQEQTDTSYKPPRPQQLHGAFITLNATLKAADDLDDAGMYAGALYRYLNAVQDFGTLDPPSPGGGERGQMPAKIAALRGRLAANHQDGSLPELFLEHAEALMAEAPSSKDWAQVALLVDRVVPAWFAVIAAPAPPPMQMAANVITVTLVRWPYTCNLSDPASLIIQQVVDKYPGKVKFANENFGASKLAERFGVDRYPAVFVNDILIATPRDFGFFGEGDTPGRYAPWLNPDSQARFKDDLTHMVDLVLSGNQDQVRREGVSAGSGGAGAKGATAANGAGGANGDGDRIDRLPDFSLTDLAGKPLTRQQVSGRVVLVEFWASWCIPCRTTLDWLGKLQHRYGDKVAVLALAVESPPAQVRSTVAKYDPSLRWAIADATTARSFGHITAVPTMFLFDRNGKTARVLYGAPPDLHDQAESVLTALLR
jgi:thiol-disulfide isomerase/thioredoxin